MKILITGFNKAQTTKDFFLRQELEIVPSHYSLIRALEDMGHTVEHRHVVVGEDLSSWDKIICYIHSPKAYCQRLFGGLYTIATRPDSIIAIDDWQVDQIVSSVSDLWSPFFDQKKPKTVEYIMSLQEEKYDVGFIMDRAEMFAQGIKQIESRTNRLLISAFSGGDVGLLESGWPVEMIFPFNPNPYHLNRTPQNNYGRGPSLSFDDDVIKKREWNFASLVQNKTRKWITKSKFGWPVNYYGTRRGEFKSERVTEGDMCEIFNTQWGSLVPSYYHAGSGWWRARPLQLADVGSVMLCQSDKESKIYGEAYVGLKTADIEAMDDTQLANLAARQRECLYDLHPLNKDVEKEELRKVLE